jgi:hypothetical protein
MRWNPIRVSPGEVYNRWTVVETDVRDTSGNRAALCRCACGTEKVVRLTSLTSGAAKSCGCYNRERILERNTRHGLAYHPVGVTWYAMMGRCYDTSAVQYKDWGGRGIKVAPEWHDIKVFVEWIEENLGPCPEGCSLDRIDNDGDYEPGNVRWATRSQQSLNRRK